MAQRQDPIQAEVRGSRGWYILLASIALLLLVAPGLPASLSIAGGVALVVLVGFILHEDGRRSGDSSSE